MQKKKEMQMKFSQFILDESLTRNQARALFFKVYEKVFKDFRGLAAKYDAKIVGDDNEELELQFNDWHAEGTETSLTIKFVSDEFKEDPRFAKEFGAALKKEVNQMRKFIEVEKMLRGSGSRANTILLYFNLKLPKAN